MTTGAHANQDASRHVKELYNFECQVCGQTLVTPEGRYSEAVHVRPLGEPHNGPDSEDNLLSLCPNHRVMFDHGTFGIGDDYKLIGIRLYGRLRVNPEHKLNAENLRYHREHILKES